MGGPSPDLLSSTAFPWAAAAPLGVFFGDRNAVSIGTLVDDDQVNALAPALKTTEFAVSGSGIGPTGTRSEPR